MLITAVCVDNGSGYKALTIGKLYTAEIVRDQYYRVTNDAGNKENFHMYRFRKHVAIDLDCFFIRKTE